MPRTRLAIYVVAATVVAAASVAVLEAKHALPLLDGTNLVAYAQAARQRLAYIATAESMVVYGSRRLRSVAQIASAPGGRSRITYVAGDLKGAVVGSDGRRLWRYDPRARRVVVGAGTVTQPDARILLVNHDVTVDGSDRVAGRPVYVVSLMTRNDHRRLQRLWLDAETYLPLRFETYGPQGHLMSSTVYKTIEYRAPDPSVFRVPVASGTPVLGDVHEPRRCASLTELEHLVGTRVLLPRYVPVGLSAVTYYCRTCPYCHRKSSIVRYSNGVSSFVVYQCSPSCRVSDVLAARDFGPGRIVHLTTSRARFCLVGNLPASEMKRVADSLPR